MNFIKNAGNGLKYPLLAAAGAIAGFACGLLGAGGGMIVLLALTLLYPSDDARDRFAMTVCSVLPVTAVSAIFYAFRNGIDTDAALSLLVPAAVGGFIGSMLLGKLPLEPLKLLLSVILLISGGAMLLGG